MGETTACLCTNRKDRRKSEERELLGMHEGGQWLQLRPWRDGVQCPERGAGCRRSRVHATDMHVGTEAGGGEMGAVGALGSSF